MIKSLEHKQLETPSENLEAYLTFMEKWHHKMLDDVWEEAVNNPSTRSVFKDATKDELLKETINSFNMVAQAYQTGDWSDYIQQIEKRAKEFAPLGFTLQDWIVLLNMYRDQLPPFLVMAYPNDTESANQVWRGANALSDFILRVVSGTYIGVKEGQLQQEKVKFKNAQNKLLQSEEKLKAIFKSTSDHLFVVDREARITMINHTAPGIALESTIGTQVYDYQDEATRKRVASALNTVFTEGISVVFETDYLVSPTEKYIFSNSAAPIIDREGNINEAVIISRDVTKKRQLEQERSGLFEVIKRSLNEIYMFSPEDLKFQFVNEGALKNLGYSQNEITELTPINLKPEYDLPSFKMLLQKLKERDNKKIKFETFHRRKDGSHYDVEVHLQLVPYHEGEIYLAVINDITERNENQRRLNQSISDLRNVQERLELSVEGSSSGLWDWNLQTDEIFFSSRFKRLLGYEPYEFEDKFQSFYHALHRSDRRRVLQAITDSLDNIRSYDITYRLQLKDGSYRWFLARASVLFNEEAVPFRMAGSLADIDERIQAELQLENMNRNLEKMVDERTAELRAINKELESFSYSVSHDLRTPLRAISGFAKILSVKAKDQLDEEQQKFLQIIRDNVVSMDQLIEDLLGYSKMGRAQISLKQIDMHRLVNEVLEEILDPEDAERLMIRVGDLPKIKADLDQMKRVWSNLLSNAIKFSRDKKQPEIRISAEEQENEVIYRVSDNGAGFDMRYAGKLFSIFQRLHSQKEFPGTGVGLAIVHRIILKHGGEIWAESKPDQGATFSFSIPKNILVSK